MATYKELIVQKQALEAQIEEARATEVASVIEQIRGLMSQYGLSPEDVAPRRRRGRPAGTASAPAEKEPLPPKYMDPKTGKTWSGRGRAPAWLGKRPERFLIPQE
ncbi:histone-like nucleoid-structuring protein H-NS (plasmid) [Cupriavidus necator N-1]|jgi:DNA-binding protein H-NS|uniref:Histone-like nucleoid-structuring protein H-NS n=1 Tax=Cupriavidus necator (strain ATCC 43291 / DSM 13513 / CCUG 52238 / LMG 8453 / N-1) TaxID=1042878 RepID=F8GUR1_CUPNN|nr:MULTISPECIES: H-NS histone family protein [Cupriavidus]AEI82465.1 histone-like nucleoid-structuring protein H-NS [Cupriavidus necator N-1]EYS85840.1 DNA-binding protein [Cupriavidus sp. SK-4]MDX6007470.1 H-NS histone family protein [Cupriavidus necator]QUN31937.1 H-NS histone family protein [Cupriavidus sp. KK10]